ncbi:hypothetical protein [Mesobacillus zeae]|uniref:YTH domain-containing protein n=1 Tax=Mesobacillus zeae TaxID=1917180 RepID=A0A398B578_9BACI|nr:hypothetical protein [Mesobacillus zeae]RID85012.1 hypothetical protein D1970_10620 [Mesobacillus zeae]
MSIFQSILQSLPDAFSKKADSNIGRLMLILSNQIDQLNTALTKIDHWRNIDEAEGSTLEQIGKNVGQKRGLATDEIMRVLIKARIARNRSDGTINSVIDALSRSLNTSPSTIKLKALYQQGEPAALMIEDLPLTALNKVGMSVGQFAYITQQVVGAGIRITNIDVRGTFIFSSQPSNIEASFEFGFAPLDQSSGGRLGATFNPNEDVILPF